MITFKIQTSKIDKSLMFQGKPKNPGEKGEVYLDCVLFENKDGVSEYGDHGRVVQSVPKEQREKGVKGPIIGNYRIVGENTPAAPAPTPAARPAPTKTASRPAPRNDFAADDSVPF